MQYIFINMISEYSGKQELKLTLKDIGLIRIPPLWAEFVKLCNDFPHLITVYDAYKFNTREGTEAEACLENSILEALFKSREMLRDERSALVEIKLAIHWDRIDKAKSVLFDLHFRPSSLISDTGTQIGNQSLFQIALEKNRVNFIRDFIERGVIVGEFLTTSILSQLYSHIVCSSFFLPVHFYRTYKMMLVALANSIVRGAIR